MRAAKQVIVIRRDLGMRRGKEIAQGSHASMAFLTERMQPKRRMQVFMLTDAQQEWLAYGRTKIVCQVPSEAQLHYLHMQAQLHGVEAHLIRDAGHTEIAAGTITALAVGPAWTYLVDAVTSGLELY